MRIAHDFVPLVDRAFAAEIELGVLRGYMEIINSNPNPIYIDTAKQVLLAAAQHGADVRSAKAVLDEYRV